MTQSRHTKPEMLISLMSLDYLNVFSYFTESLRVFSHFTKSLVF